MNETEVITSQLKWDAAKGAVLTCAGWLVLGVWILAIINFALFVLALVLIWFVSYKNRLSDISQYFDRLERMERLLAENKPLLAEREFGGTRAPSDLLSSRHNQMWERIRTTVSQYKEKERLIEEKVDKEAREETHLQIQTAETLDGLSPQEFELVVLEAFSRKGFRAEHTPWVADGGVDGILTRGHERVAIQCKKHKAKVGEPALRDFLGAIEHSGFSKGIFVTTSSFSEPAQRFAKGKRITLMDGAETLRFLRSTINYDFVVNGRTIIFHKPSEKRTCSECGGHLKRRRGWRGLFWGCENYPQCRHSED